MAECVESGSILQYLVLHLDFLEAEQDSVLQGFLSIGKDFLRVKFWGSDRIFKIVSHCNLKYLKNDWAHNKILSVAITLHRQNKTCFVENHFINFVVQKLLRCER